MLQTYTDENVSVAWNETIYDDFEMRKKKVRLAILFHVVICRKKAYWDQ